MSKEPPIDLDYRPENYGNSPDPIVRKAHRIIGEWRRNFVIIVFQEGCSDLVPDAFFRDSIGDSLCEVLRRIGLQFSEGERLPDYFPTEVEIARVVAWGEKPEVTSIRALTDEVGCFDCRIVEEGSGDFCEEIHIEAAPAFSMGELLGLIDEHWGNTTLVEGYAERLLNEGVPAEKVPDYIEVKSLFYPQLAHYYRMEAEEWLRRHTGEAYEDVVSSDIPVICPTCEGAGTVGCGEVNLNPCSKLEMTKHELIVSAEMYLTKVQNLLAEVRDALPHREEEEIKLKSGNAMADLTEMRGCLTRTHKKLNNKLRRQ